MSSQAFPFKIRVPAASRVAMGAVIAHGNVSDFARRAVRQAAADPQRIARAFEKRFGRDLGPIEMTSVALDPQTRETLDQLAVYCHLPLNDVCVLAIEAAID